jgi:uncharacterized protein with von Willebrand factor type A (vWA) domain
VSLIAHLLLFARTLRQAGALVTTQQVTTLVEALLCLPSLDRENLRHAARCTLVCRQQDLALFDQLFDRFFRAEQGGLPPDEPQAWRLPRPWPSWVGDMHTLLPSTDGEEGRREVVSRLFSYSPLEVMRRRRWEGCTPEEGQVLRQLLMALRHSLSMRRTYRLRRSRRRRHPDLRRTLRQSLRHGGELVGLAWRERARRPRPLVVLADISGSMEIYTRTVLLFIYALAQTWPKPVEAFLFGSRLTRITPCLGIPSPDLALEQVARWVTDWAGGTRIGACLRQFHRLWGRRVLGRGAVVIVISDGWDQGEPELLAQEMERLQKRCHRLIWLNPLLGVPGYQPLTRGMQAALPFVDDFLPGHDMASLQAVARHLCRLPSRRPHRSPGASAGRVAASL